MPLLDLTQLRGSDPAQIIPPDDAATMRKKLHIGPREALQAGILSLPFLSSLPRAAEAIGELAYPKQFVDEPGYEVDFKELEGYEGYYHDLLGAKSPAELLHRKGQVEKRMRRRDALNYGGGWSALGVVMGAAVDPLNAVGAGILSRGSLSGSFRLGGAVAAGEVLAQNEDPYLTAGDSALNITIGAVAGHVLGGMKGVSPAEAYEVGRRFADDYDAAEATAGVRVKPGLLDPSQVRDPVKPGIIDPSQATDMDGAGAAAVHGGAGAFQAGSPAQRAAQAQARLDEMLENEGMVTAFGLERLNDNAIKRLLKSRSLAARDAIGRLTEIPFLQKKNQQGGTTYTSAWQKYRRRRGELASAMKDTEEQYWLYRERVSTGGQQVKRSLLRQGAQDYLHGRNGAMSFGEFRAKVGWAKSQLDDGVKLGAHEPEVVAAAKAWEGRVYGPLGKEADELDLFTHRLRRQKEAAEEKLKTTRSAARTQELRDEIAGLERRIDAARKGVQKPGYVNRIFLVPEILGRRDEFRSILQSHLRLNQKQADALIDDIVKKNHYSPVDVDATGEAASLKQRSLRDIPDEAFDGFIERDIYALGQRYHRTMGTDVELAREFGGEIDMRSLREEVKADYKQRIDNEVDPARKVKLKKRMDRDLQDLVDVRDMYRGTFGISDDPTRFTSRAIRLVKYWNTLTQLTGAVAALPDIGRLVMRHGLERSLKSGLMPLFKNIEAYKLAGQELNLAGEALDMYLGVRAAAFADIADTFSTSSRFERAVGKAAQMSFTVNLMNQWTDAIKSVTSMIAGTRILDDAEKLVGGTLDATSMARLANLGIDREMAERIVAQAGAHRARPGQHRLAAPGAQQQTAVAQPGGHATTFDHVRIANTDLWTDRAAAEAYRDALAKDVNISIVTPAPGERATWTSTEWGGLVSQFKGFGMSATQRVLMAGLQERDANFFIGATVMVGLGALLDRVRRWQKDDEREVGFGEQLGNAIDRSGVLGWFMDVNNGLERLTNNSAGLGPLLGAESGGSRPLQRLSGVAGPTAGTLDNFVTMMSAYGDDRGLSSRAMRRLMPLNNAWWADGLFDQVEEAAK